MIIVIDYSANRDSALFYKIRNTRIYYHADGLGSITALTNHMGMPIQRYDYDALGNLQCNPFPQWIRQPYTYTGREYDPETGLYYYRARYYDARAGRFITRDPIGFEGGDYNLYNYVSANPVNNVDPLGLKVKLCKRDLDTREPSRPFYLGSRWFYYRLFHAFISVNQETFGLTTHNKKISIRCGFEGPGYIEHNLGIDKAAEIEGYMNAHCQNIECPCEQKLLDNLRTAVPPYYCLRPNSGFGMNCQEWARMMLDKYCSSN